MKNNLFKLFITAILSFSLLGVTGCSSLKTNPDKLAQTKLLVQITASTAANHVIKADAKNGKAYLVLVSAAMGNFLTSTNFSPIELSNAIQAVPVKELKSSVLAEFTPILLGVYAIYLDGDLKAKFGENVVAKELVSGIKDGIDQVIKLN